MTEEQPDASAATVPVNGPSDGPPGGPSARRGRKLLTVVLPAVLVVGAVGGGLTYTAVTVNAADRTAETIVWEPPMGTPPKDPAAGVARGRASTPLSKLLLPVPQGYRLGPDIDAYGNDGELTEKQAVALLKEEGRGLSGKKRRDYEKRVDTLGVRGIAMRSFSASANDLVVEVEIIRMKNKSRLHDMYEVKTELYTLLEFPKGPAIKGHKNSACFLMPKQKGDGEGEGEGEEKRSELDGMTCAAYDSELLVTVSASGSKPFDKGAVSELVKKQLDHISSPGEYV